MFTLNSKISIVTGATSGIGRASALALAKQGSTVVVSGRRETEGQSVVKEIEANGGKAIFIKADVTKPEDVANLFAQTKSQFGKIDVVFLNSGVFRFTPLVDQTAEDLHNQIDINVNGVFYGLQEAARHLDKGASVIVTSSVVADIGIPTGAAYSLTKGAVNTLVRVAAVELAPQNIRVNAVAPGPIWTEGALGMTGSRENFDAYMGPQTAMGRVGEADEVASAVVFFASDEASFITGQVLTIDGGLGIK